MVEVIKNVLDPNGVLSVSDELYAAAGVALLALSFILMIKFLLDFVRGLFPSFR